MPRAFAFGKRFVEPAEKSQVLRVPVVRHVEHEDNLQILQLRARARPSGTMEWHSYLYDRISRLTAVRLEEAETVSTQTPNRAWVRAWLPTFLWLAVIAIESTDWLSSEHTGGLLYPLFHRLFGLTAEQFEPLHAILRKTGHVVGYGTLSVLAFRSFRVSAPLPAGRWAIAWARNAVILTATVASLDEWHQTFIPSRTGTIRDVLLDTSAAIAAQVLVYFFLRMRSRRPTPLSST